MRVPIPEPAIEILSYVSSTKIGIFQETRSPASKMDTGWETDKCPFDPI